MFVNLKIIFYIYTNRNWMFYFIFVKKILLFIKDALHLSKVAVNTFIHLYYKGFLFQINPFFYFLPIEES